MVAPAIDPALLQALADRINGAPPNGHQASDFDDPLNYLWSDLDSFPNDPPASVFVTWAGNDPNRMYLAGLIAALLPTGPVAVPRIIVHHFAEALVRKAPPRWIVEDLFTEGSLNVLFGLPGGFKTWAALDLCMCVALGKPWLGRAVIQSPAYVVDEEMGVRWIEDRLGWVGRGYNAPATTPIAYSSLSMLDLRRDGDITALSDVLAKEKPGLMIIDPLADVMPGGDENSVQDVQPLFRGLRKLANDHNCCILVLHHPNKAGRFRGSSAIMGAVDSMLVVEAGQSKTEIVFKSEKTRHGRPVHFTAEIVSDPIDDSFRLQLSQNARAASVSNLSPSRQFVVNHLQVNGPSSQSDLETHGATYSATTIRRAVQDLVNAGAIRRSNPGAQGKTAVYEMAPGQP